MQNIIDNIIIATMCVMYADVDECETRVDECDEKANCTNTEGSYNCTCFIGYSGNGTFCEGTYIHNYKYSIMFPCDELIH